MDELSTGSDSDYANSWITWFLSTKGNEYFCEVDEEYILDRFNLTGLNSEVPRYSHVLDLITDAFGVDDLDEATRENFEVAARHLYGLIHARYIITSRGLAKMLEKYKKADFGRCPRVKCNAQPVLPVGLSDSSYSNSVKLYCPRCEDIYSPKSSRHGVIDGAYFGTSFPHMLFMVYPHMIPTKTWKLGTLGGNQFEGSSQSEIGPTVGASSSNSLPSTIESALTTPRYFPRIFGFKVHQIAKLQRWQENLRDEQIDRLKKLEQEGQIN